MTARAETLAPLSSESRLALRSWADELLEIETTLDRSRAELSDEIRWHGLPADPDIIRLLAEARDLVGLARRRTDPDDRGPR